MLKPTHEDKSRGGLCRRNKSPRKQNGGVILREFHIRR